MIAYNIKIPVDFGDGITDLPATFPYLNGKPSFGIEFNGKVVIFKHDRKHNYKAVEPPTEHIEDIIKIEKQLDEMY